MDIKPTKSFVLKKMYKTLIALSRFDSVNQRNQFRQGMIQAQLASEVKVKSARTRDVNNMAVPDTEV